jgi:hypothetical protein
MREVSKRLKPYPKNALYEIRHSERKTETNAASVLLRVE